MSVNPQAGGATGSGVGPQIARLHEKIADDRRRLRAIEGQLGGIGADTITGSHIAPNSVDAEHVAAGSISAGHIGANTIQATHLSAGSVTAGSIQAGSIQAAHISAGAINANHIQAATIQATHLSAGSITASHIQSNSITATHIAAGTITATEIQAGSITATHVAAGTLTAQHIAAGSITANEIAANSITADKITATTLQTLWTNAALITGSTIRGGRFVTSTADSGSRIDIDSTGLKGYSSAGVETFRISSGTGVFIQADPTSFVPATTLTGFVGGSNFLVDSSFESTDPAYPASLWSTTNATIAKSASFSFDGSKSLAVTRTAGADAYATASTVAFPNTTAARLAGKPVVFSAWVYVPLATKNSGLFSGSPDRSVFVYDGVSGAAGQASLSSIPADTWTRVVVKYTMASNTSAIMLRLNNTFTTGAVYYDGVQFEIGDAATAYSPKADEIIYDSIRSVHIGAGEIKANNILAGAVQAQHISVQFGGANRVKNSRGEIDPNTANTEFAWTSFQSTLGQITNDGVSSLKAFSVTSTTAGGSAYIYREWNSVPAVRVVAGSKVTVSAWVKGGNAGGTGRNLALEARWGGDSPTIDSSPIFTSTGTWQRISHTFTVPANKTTMGYSCLFAATAVGQIVHWTDIQVEPGDVLSAYAPMPEEILPGSIGPTQITPNSITSNEINAGSIRTAILTANTISSGMISAGAITADKISVGANSDNMVANGGFEDSTGENSPPKAWYAGEGGGALYGNTSNAAVPEGTWECAINPSNNSISSRIIPVVPGQVYRVRAMMKHDTTTNYAYFRINYATSKPTDDYISVHNRSGLFDFFGSTNAGTDSQISGNSTTIPTSYTAYEYQWKAPAGVHWASVCFYNWTTTGYLRVDDVKMSPVVHGTQILPGGITTNHIAAGSITADKITMSTGGSNLLKNASFTVGGFGATVYQWGNYGSVATWEQVNGAGTNAWPAYVKIVPSGTGSSFNNARGLYQTVTVEGLKKYSAQCGFYNDAGTRTARFYIDWYASGGSHITATSRQFSIPANTWTYVNTDMVDLLGVSGAWTAPSNAITAVVYFWIEGTTGPESVYFNRPQFESGEKASGWAQGISPTVIDGDSITSGIIRTNSSNTRVQMDNIDGITVWNGGVMTAQMKAGLGGLDLTSASAANFSSVTHDRKLRWMNPGNTTGEPVLSIAGFLDSTQTLWTYSDIRSITQPGRDNTYIETRAHNAGTGRYALLGSQITGNSGTVYASTDANGTYRAVTIINSNDFSSFMRIQAGTHKISADWTGTALRFWVDNTLVVQINVPSFPRTV